MADTWWRGIQAEICVVSETRIHTENEGKFPYGFLRDSLRFPAEFIGIFGGFIGDKKWRILGESSRDSQEKSWEILQWALIKVSQVLQALFIRVY